MKCSVYIAATADGFIARKDGGIDWLETAGDPEKGVGEGYIDFETFIATVDCMIMGRKTFESFGARPLPNRHHIVVSRDPNFTADFEQVTVVREIPQAIETGQAICAKLDQSALWVIGGAQIYAQTIDQADRLELTLVNLTPECDAFYPDVPADFEFSSRESHTDPGSGVDYQFLSFVRKWG